MLSPNGMSSSKDGDPLGIIGTTVDGKYSIESLAGEGGYSAVYRAEHLVWNEPVAIKFFSLLEDAKPELREQLLSDFIQEGKLMTQLSSRSAAIVQARDIGKLVVDDDEWIPFMVLEWLDGEPLDKILRREMAAGLHPRTIEQAMALLEPVADAVFVAHEAGVAHRDMKPANIVVLGDPREPGVTVKVLDFGIAKVMAAHTELQEQLQLTGQQITAFTPNYGAPEQFSRNFGATGPWTDVYAMALIVIELLRGGHRALEGGTFFELGVKSCDATTRPTPRSLGLEIRPEIEAVFSKALALQPKDRYPDMGAFWAALHQVVYPGSETWTRSRRFSTSAVMPRPSLGVGATGPQAVIAGNIASDDAASEPTEALPTGEQIHTGDQLARAAGMSAASLPGPAPTDGTHASVISPAGPSNGNGRPLAVGAALALVAVVGVSVVWLGSTTGTTEPEPARAGSSEAAPDETVEPVRSAEPVDEPVRSAEPEASSTPPDETAEPEASAETSRPPISPVPVVRPVPPKPEPSQDKPPPPPDKGGDPFDPNNFGGR